MKKSVYYCIIAFICFTIAACSDGRMASLIEREELANISDQTTIIDIDKHLADSFLISHFIQDVRYVQLETLPEACLSVPMNIKTAGDVIYVSDIEGQLFCFDRNGKFIRRPFQKGRGKREVLRMYDYDVDDSLLYVLDGTRSYVLTYRHNGDFVDSRALPFRAISIKRLNNCYIFQLAPYGLNNDVNDDVVAVTDNNFKVLSTMFRYNIKQCNPVTRTPYFTSGQDTILFAPIYGRSIYQMSQNGFFMKYYLKFNTPYYEPGKNFNGAKEAAEKKSFYTYDNPIEGEDYIFQNFVSSKECKGMLIIDKKEERYLFVGHLIHDSNKVYNFNIGDTKYYDSSRKEFISFANNYYVGVHDAEIEEIRKCVSDSIAAYMIKSSEAFSENPLLLFYSICPDII